MSALLEQRIASLMPKTPEEELKIKREIARLMPHLTKDLPKGHIRCGQCNNPIEIDNSYRHPGGTGLYCNERCFINYTED